MCRLNLQAIAQWERFTTDKDEVKQLTQKYVDNIQRFRQDITQIDLELSKLEDQIGMSVFLVNTHSYLRESVAKGFSLLLQNTKKLMRKFWKRAYL